MVVSYKGFCLMNEEEFKRQLLEIINTIQFIVEDRRDLAKESIKACLERFKHDYENLQLWDGMTLRVKVKFRMMCGFMLSCKTVFPKSEQLWRPLHQYTLQHYNPQLILISEYIIDHPEKKVDLLIQEQESIKEINNSIELFPIPKCEDYSHLVEAFDMYRNLAHIYSYQDAIHKPYDKNWVCVNPYQLPTGRSMLVDYIWGIPDEYKDFGNYVLSKLASSELKSIKDLNNLRIEVEQWKPN